MTKRISPAAKPATRKGVVERAKRRRPRSAEAEDATLAAYYDEMFALQHGACAVCRQKFDERLTIDRNPDAGFMMALLCPGCVKLMATMRHVWKYRHRFYAFLKEWQGEDYARRFWNAYHCDIPERWERKGASAH